MRKIRIDKETEINGKVIKWIIEKHKEEKDRISSLREYYNNNNLAIMNREYKDKKKPQNKLAHPFASYITNMAVGYFLGRPVAYNSENADLLVVGWGGTEGALRCAVQELQAEGKSIAFTQFNYIMPLPKNTEEMLKRYKKVVVCELNMGQFVNYLRMNFQGMMFHQYNKVQGLPFEVSELKEVFNQILGE